MNIPSLSVLLASLVLTLAPSEAEAGGGVSISYRSGGLRVQASIPRPALSYGGYRSSRVRHAPCRPRRVFVPGHYEWVEQGQWVPGPTRQVWIAPAHQVVLDSCGRPRTVLLTAGHFESVTGQGHFVVHQVRVWRPGAWSVR
jgi:hypothetical protein